MCRPTLQSCRISFSDEAKSTADSEGSGTCIAKGASMHASYWESCRCRFWRCCCEFPSLHSTSSPAAAPAADVGEAGAPAASAPTAFGSVFSHGTSVHNACVNGMVALLVIDSASLCMKSLTCFQLRFMQHP